MLTLLPGTARAEVCEAVRPGWDGIPITAAQEAMALMFSPLGLLLLALSLIVLRFRLQWLGMGTILGWTGFVALVTLTDPTGTRGPAIAEGCIGSPTLFIALSAAICVAIVFLTKPRPTADPGSGTPPEA